mmetsp:Transcript_63329/g.148727  ORF Transcript_63329/g.148727 Transcript_63329/m.148727 type:complete len:211 (-) Transcript_63329:1876-2508(-)
MLTLLRRRRLQFNVGENRFGSTRQRRLQRDWFLLALPYLVLQELEIRPLQLATSSFRSRCGVRRHGPNRSYLPLQILPEQFQLLRTFLLHVNQKALNGFDCQQARHGIAFVDLTADLQQTLHKLSQFERATAIRVDDLEKVGAIMRQIKIIHHLLHAIVLNDQQEKLLANLHAVVDFFISEECLREIELGLILGELAIVSKLMVGRSKFL